MAAGKLRGLSAEQLANALGIAASSAAGLFAFVNGGADIKRLHAGHASREGLQAALLAEQGIEGPPDVIEARDGFMQAFAFGRADKARAIVLPPKVPFGITDCYIKPYPCCRHIQPAVEALIGLLDDEKIATDEVQRIDVATYRIAAEHAETGWDDFASAQLSFPYLMGVALKFRGIKFEHFTDAMRQDPSFATIARKLNVTAPPDIDRLYPQLRPARVTVTTARGSFTRQADEALGSRIVPLDDAGLKAKFLDLVGPVLGAAKAKELAERRVGDRGNRRRGAAGGVDGEVAQVAHWSDARLVRVVNASQQADEFIRLRPVFARRATAGSRPSSYEKCTDSPRGRASAWSVSPARLTEARDSSSPLANLASPRMPPPIAWRSCDLASVRTPSSTLRNSFARANERRSRAQTVSIDEGRFRLPRSWRTKWRCCRPFGALRLSGRR